MKKNKDFFKAYRDYYPLVFRILTYKVVSEEDAEDICQEVFIQFYKNFDEIINKKNWLMKALNFEITNYYRKKGNKKVDKVDIDGFADNIELSYEEKFNEERLIIKEAIENPDNFEDESEKVLFDLIAIYNYTYKDAAKYLDLSKSQVRYKYLQIEKRIAEYLKLKGIEVDNLS